MKKIIALFCTVLMIGIMTTPVYAAKKDTTAPIITKSNPVNSTANIMVESNIIIRFSKSIQKGKSFSKIVIKELETTDVSYTCEVKNNLLIITPKTKLNYNTLYSVTIPSSAVKDKAGNTLKRSYNLKFMTEEESANQPVVVDENGNIYRLELEANLGYEVTDEQIEYFVQLLKMIGIDAQVVDYYKVEDEN